MKMDEKAWLESDDPTLMLEFVSGKASERRLRLFGCAAGRLAMEVCVGGSWRVALGQAERLADGAAPGGVGDTRRRCEALCHYSQDVFEVELASAAIHLLGAGDALRPGDAADLYAGVYATAVAGCGEAWDHDRRVELRRRQRAGQADLLRDIIGNPFRPVSFDPSWRASVAVDLAVGIYRDRDWSRMCILADALQDAGAEGDILDHLRGPGPHARGCHVLDAILGKE